jgi:hypothetical protein
LFLIRLRVFDDYSDYVNGGELFTHLNKRQHFSEQDAKIYIAELTLALGQLHKVKKFDEEFFFFNLSFRLAWDYLS